VGSFTSFNPRLVLCLCLLFTIITGLGWLELEPERRPEKLYTPQTSKAIDDEVFVSEHFPLSVRIINVFYIHAHKGGNLIADAAAGKDPIRDLFTLYESIDLADAIGSGGITLHDICIKNAQDHCRKMSVLGFWGYSRYVTLTLILTLTFILYIARCIRHSYSSC